MSASEPRILIVEDEPKLASVLADYLRAAGFGSSCVGDGTRVMSALDSYAPDLILLDLMLPGRDGLSVCKDVRAVSQVPIIMTTARVEELDRLLGLELGADDYICKPFSPREVVARVKAVLRRSTAPFVAQATAGLTVDPARHLATCDGSPLDLTPAEFRLLQTFMEAPGRVFSRGQLLHHVYQDGRIVTDRTVDSHVKNLRKKLARARPGVDLIQSVYGVGYKMEPPVT